MAKVFSYLCFCEFVIFSYLCICVLVVFVYLCQSTIATVWWQSCRRSWPKGKTAEYAHCAKPLVCACHVQLCNCTSKQMCSQLKPKNFASSWTQFCLLLISFPLSYRVTVQCVCAILQYKITCIAQRCPLLVWMQFFNSALYQKCTVTYHTVQQKFCWSQF